MEIGAHVEGAELGIDVSDEGAGVAAEDRERIFAPFHRLPRGDRAPTKGAGLGLAIARRLVEAHGGRIWVEAGPGRGPRFVVALPPETMAVPRWGGPRRACPWPTPSRRAPPPPGPTHAGPASPWAP